jgi:protein O-GlcNAc transferase
MLGQIQCGRVFVKPICFALMSVSHLGYSQPATEAVKQADAAYRAGLAALARQDLVTAQTDFEQVVRLAPHVEEGHSALGTVLIYRGRTREGIRELETALAIKRTDTNARMNLAIAYQQIGSSAKAIPLFAELEENARLQKQALSVPVLSAYARALAATGMLSQAAIKMKAALQSDPRNAELHDELGSIYAQQKDWSAAQQEFTVAVQLSPELPVAHLHLGLAMQAQGESDGLKELSQARLLAPDSAIIAIELGKILAEAGQDAEAIPLFQQVLDRDPKSVVAMYQLALALQRSNRVQEAIVLLREVVAIEPDNSAALTNLGMALTQAQLAKDAIPVLQRSVSLAPQDVTARQDLSAAYVQLSQFGDAANELRAALKLAPDLPQLHYNLGLALKMQDDAAGAIPELETAERLDPSAPEAPYLLGILYMQTGRYDDAAREMNISLKRRPESGDGWATLGSVYEKLNKLPEATAALREAIHQLPSQPDPHLTLAAVLVKQNQPVEAAAERKKAADLMRANMNHQRAEIATNAGNSLLRSGDVDGSIVQFRDALSYDANYAEAHLGLANALDRQGKTAEAAAERQKAEAVKTGANP